MKNRIKIKLRRIIARRFSPVIRLLYKIKFNRINFNKASPYLVLTPGKVGSASVYSELKKRLLNPVFHILKIGIQSVIDSKQEHLSSDRKSLPLHLIESELLVNKLKSYDGLINIITIIREPIGRAISSLFQNSELYRNSIENKNFEINESQAYTKIQTILEREGCQYLENWFEKELKSPFGIDVFAQEFNNEKQFQIIRNGQVNLLLLKMETMNEVFDIAMKEFTNTESQFNLDYSNVGSNKLYNKEYKSVKEKLKISNSAISNIVNSNYFKHFYSEFTQEIRDNYSSND